MFDDPFAVEIERLRERLANLQHAPPNVLFYQEQAEYGAGSPDDAIVRAQR